MWQGHTTCLQYIQIPPSSPGTIFSLEWLRCEVLGEHLAGGRREKRAFGTEGDLTRLGCDEMEKKKKKKGKLKRPVESFMPVPVWFSV